MIGLVTPRAVGAGAEAAGWACRLRVDGGGEVASFPFSPYSSLGGFLGELMEEEWKASEGCCPSIPLSVAPHQAPLCHPPVALDPAARCAPLSSRLACARRTNLWKGAGGSYFAQVSALDPFFTYFFSLSEKCFYFVLSCLIFRSCVCTCDCTLI